MKDASEDRRWRFQDLLHKLIGGSRLAEKDATKLSENTRRFVHILDKIPLFQRLTPAQAVENLKICKPQSFSQKEVLCEFGSKSTEMHILLLGKLVVTAQDGTALTSLTPITTVGEMGVIKAQPRCGHGNRR